MPVELDYPLCCARNQMYSFAYFAYKLTNELPKKVVDWLSFVQFAEDHPPHFIRFHSTLTRLTTWFSIKKYIYIYFVVVLEYHHLFDNFLVFKFVLRTFLSIVGHSMAWKSRKLWTKDQHVSFVFATHTHTQYIFIQINT